MQDMIVGKYMVSVNVKHRASDIIFSITGVYGPQLESEKEEFLTELQMLRQSLLPKWVVMGDFNLIYRTSQKNNSRINYRMMNQFKNTLDSLELKELHLHGRLYTWSSGTENPTFTKIDHLFYTEQWEFDYPNCYIQALSSSMSDHCPLLLSHMPQQRGQGIQI
jgi:mannosylglycoprotein endo-beta-mannosidase